MRILLVDDDERHLSVAGAHLSPLGHTLLTATSGAEALGLLDAGPVDLVLLDVRMPGIDGIDVLLHIRARPALDRLPVVLVTGLNDRDDRLRGLEAGADDFVVKPVDPAVLRARVTNLLRLKQAGDDLSRANEDLRRLEALRKELTDLVVHDMKAPIAGASLNIEVALEALPPDEAVARDALQDALLGVHRVHALVEDVLLLARLEEARMPIRPEPVFVRAVVDEVVRTLGRTVTRRGVELTLAIDEGVLAFADPGLLRRVVENLVDNALRHVPKGGRVEVRASVDGDVTLRFANTGRPIPASERARIFEKFARAEGVVAQGVNVGLGLHFCHVVAEAHGGSIRVDQTEAWPVVFTLHLPGPG